MLRAMIYLVNLCVHMYILLALSRTTHEWACFDIVYGADSPPTFEKYAKIHIANLFANRLQTRALVHELHN